MTRNCTVIAKLTIVLLLAFTMSSIEAASSDVTDHVVQEGDHVTFTCIKPEGGTIVWDSENAGIIAVDGALQGNIGDKFSLSVDGRKQVLKLLDIVLGDNGVYRCYTLFQSDFVNYNVTVVGKKY
jgi:hypothetical protein